jgi:RNA polymerase sigma factor (TIGR02999 family)
VSEVERLLERVKAREADAAAELFQVLYGELRALAERLFRGQRRGHTLQPTALLHEAYLKVVQAPGAWQDKAHFFAVASKAMRQILMNHARDRAAQKRGGARGGARVTLVEVADAEGPLDLLDLHEALEELERLDARQARIAELRFFAGLSVPEVAEVLGLAPRTVELEWKMAKDLLARRLR